MTLQLDSHGWLCVSIEDLGRLTRDLPVDLFLKLSESNYCHVFSRESGLDYSRLASYRRRGVTHLHARKEDRVLLETHLHARRFEVVLADPALRPEQKAAVVLNWTDQALSEVFSGLPISEQAASGSCQLVGQYVELMTRQPQSLAALLKLFSQQDYLRYHSVAVSVFSTMLARASGKYSSDDVMLIGWGGLLHDLGASKLEGDYFCDPYGSSTGEDREMLDAHTRLGLEMVRDCPSIPKEVAHIVYQHHECPDRSGAPNGLSRSSIYVPAMLVSVVDAWSALISQVPGRSSLTPEQAMSALCSEQLVGKYDPEALELLQSVFRISPARKSAA
jgi:putative nucleotidyltransferase with HDIG domain